MKVGTEVTLTFLMHCTIRLSKGTFLFISLIKGLLLINKLYGTGHLPSKFSPNMFDSKGTDASIFMLGIGTLLIYLWGDFHFYWTHRMLHTQWFYKSVHKIHHESYNPDPFSGN